MPIPAGGTFSVIDAEIDDKPGLRHAVTLMIREKVLIETDGPVPLLH